MLSAWAQRVTNHRNALGGTFLSQVSVPALGLTHMPVCGYQGCPTHPCPSLCSWCPREALTLEVVGGKLIEVTVRVLEQRLLDWDLQSQNARVSRSHTALLQAALEVGGIYTSAETTAKDLLSVPLPCGNTARGSAGAGFLAVVVRRHFAHLGVLDQVSHTLLFSSHCLQSLPRQRRGNMQTKKYPRNWPGVGQAPQVLCMPVQGGPQLTHMD